MAGKHVTGEYAAAENRFPPRYPGCKTNRAWAEGFQRRGGSAGANPHPVGTPEWNAYNNGRGKNRSGNFDANRSPASLYSMNNDIAQEAARSRPHDKVFDSDFRDWTSVDTNTCGGGSDACNIISKSTVQFLGDTANYITTTDVGLVAGEWYVLQMGLPYFGGGLGDLLFGADPSDPANDAFWISVPSQGIDTLLQAPPTAAFPGQEFFNAISIRGRVGTPGYAGPVRIYKVDNDHDWFPRDGGMYGPAVANANSARAYTALDETSWTRDNGAKISPGSPGKNPVVHMPFLDGADHVSVDQNGVQINMKNDTFRISWTDHFADPARPFRIQFCNGTHNGIVTGDPTFVDLNPQVAAIDGNADVQVGTSDPGPDAWVEGPFIYEKL